MAKNNLLVIVVVAIVVAIIASIITANITGNVINLNADKFGKYPVYTKVEVDAKLANFSAASCNADNMCEIQNLKLPTPYDYPITMRGTLSLLTMSDPPNALATSLSKGLLTMGNNVAKSHLYPGEINFRMGNGNRTSVLSAMGLLLNNYQGIKQDSLEVTTESIVMKSIDGQRWKCAPNNSGNWVCTEY
ncbi:MAG: hypothetical protein KKA64_04120 [Nanoarchaeota archaeon]|nr:hypothetical protein [Nanoarchaeota archaeon]